MSGLILWDYRCSNLACSYIIEDQLMPRDAQLATMPCPVCACLANKIPGGQPMSSAIPSASGESKRFTDLKERRKLERQAKREPSRAKKAELRKEIKKLGGK